MKVFRNVALGLIIVLGAIIIICCSYYNYKISAVSKDDTLKNIVIEQGSVEKIAKTLKENNLIKDVSMFKLYIKMNNIKNLKASSYSLSENMSVKEIVAILVEGNSYNADEIMITFKEGINIREVARLIASNTINTEEDVYNLLKDTTYLDELINKYWFLTNDIKNKEIYYSLEGYLFPNTYAFLDSKVSVKDILKKMLDEMEKQLGPYKEDINNLDLSIHEFFTLASIVESEGTDEDDRGGIASVFHNRLNDGWKIESCVTTYYGLKLDFKDRNINTNDINSKNAYNTRGTYAIKGLPVGPVSLPGLVSIFATLYPEKTNYYFFLSDNEGTTHFSKTNAEHENKKEELMAAGKWERW